MTTAIATWWRHSRLLGRRSVVGALSIASVVAFFVFLVPFLEENVEAAGVFDDSGRFIVDDYTTMVLGDGWQLDSQSELLTILTDGTYQMVVVPSVESSNAPEETLAEFHEVYAADSANVVTDIESFSTSSGGAASTYRALLASDPDGNGAGFAAVLENGRSFQPSTSGPSDLDDPFYDVFGEMVRSVEITAEPREGSS